MTARMPEPGLYVGDEVLGISVAMTAPPGTPLASNRIGVGVHVFDPSLSPEAQRAAAVYLRRQSFFGSVLPVGLPPLVAFLVLVGVAPLFVTVLAVACAVLGSLLGWRAWCRRRAGEEAMAGFRTVALTLWRGRRRYLKPDEPAAWSDPETVATLIAVQEVGALAEDSELVSREEWRDLRAQLWDCCSDFKKAHRDVPGQSVFWRALDMRAAALRQAAEARLDARARGQLPTPENVRPSAGTPHLADEVWPVYPDPNQPHVKGIL